MIFLAVLLVAYAVTWLPPGTRRPPRERWRLALAAAMVIAGASHLIEPTPFVQHLPAWAPARGPVVAVTGLAEIGLGLALLTPGRDRARVGLTLAAFLVAVFPANVYVAVAGIDVDGQPGGLYPWVRLGFQPLFVWLATWSTRPPRILTRSRQPLLGEN